MPKPRSRFGGGRGGGGRGGHRRRMKEHETYRATRDSRVKIMVIATAKNEDEFMFMNSSTSVIMKS